MHEDTVAIIGGGFCGTLAAIRLLSTRHDTRLRVRLIEPGTPGGGLAYRAGPDHWLLNVPAGRMSAFAELPNDFLGWARQRDATVGAADFLPRAWYGDYLASRLERARRRSASRASFEHVGARAVDLRPCDGGMLVKLDDGAILHAARVLLALGNSRLAGAVPGLAREHVNADLSDQSWIDSLPTGEARVLLVGTGLTMIDIALSIAAARPQARMLAISRHGLLPRAHATGWHGDTTAHFPARRALERGPLHQRVRTLRRFLDIWQRSGGDWRAALQCVREALPQLWATLGHDDRARFLRHLRSWWDVHRHRAPAATLERIAELRSHGLLRIAAGRLLHTQRTARRVAASWRRRGSDSVHVEHFDAIVNVTGAATDPRRSDCPLVASLLERDLCRVEPLGLGWNTDGDGRMVDGTGTPSRALFYVGPLLRATYWEATAVPELRGHVDRTVAALASSLASGNAWAGRVSSFAQFSARESASARRSLQAARSVK